MCTESGNVTRNALPSLHTIQQAELKNASCQCLSQYYLSAAGTKNICKILISLLMRKYSRMVYQISFIK